MVQLKRRAALGVGSISTLLPKKKQGQSGKARTYIFLVKPTGKIINVRQAFTRLRGD